MNYEIDKNEIDCLNKKRILFFAPAFFGYESLIAEKMRELGAEVELFDERSVTSSLDRALLKVSPDIFAKKSLEYYKKIINENSLKNYDYIFVIKGDMIPISVLKELRVVFPKAKLCLYLYDSVANIPGIVKKLPFFDTCHSFDPKDCETYSQLKFRPLFFCDCYRKSKKSSCEYKYDICFLGTIHSDRYQIIKEVQKMSNINNLRQKWFLYLQSDFIYYFYKCIKKEFRNTSKSDFDFTKMSSEEIAYYVDNTNVILDIQHPKQIGLTMRTIEMLGMNKKLITTNPTIKNYDFYNSKNVLIIDRNDIKIDLSFFESNYQELDRNIYESYSLDTWVKTVLM